MENSTDSSTTINQTPDLPIPEKTKFKNSQVLLRVTLGVVLILILFALGTMLAPLKQVSKTAVTNDVTRSVEKQAVKPAVNYTSKLALIKKNSTNAFVDFDLVYQDGGVSQDLSGFQIRLVTNQGVVNPTLSKVTPFKDLTSSGFSFPVASVKLIPNTKNIEVNLMGIKMAPNTKSIFTRNQTIATVHLVLVTSGPQVVDLAFDKTLTKISDINDQNILGSTEGAIANVE